MHPRFIVNNLVTSYIFTEGSCVIKKTAYSNDETNSKTEKVVFPGIRK